MTKEANEPEEEFGEQDCAIVHHVAASVRDFVEFVILKNGADVRHAIASLALALAQLSWRQSKPGHEIDAINSVLQTVRQMHAELMEDEAKEAAEEAEHVRKTSGLN